MSVEKTSDPVEDILPKASIDRVLNPVRRLLHIETSAGIILVIVTFIALLWSNLDHFSYIALWSTPVGFSIGPFEMKYSLHWWINDALMTLFFFMVGLEVKGELVHGELRGIRSASLPLLGALGGMIFPALIYLAIAPEEAAKGWGIPMATDIAFVVGCMAILGKRIPKGLQAMLLTLAIADDIGAILVIALGYSSNVQLLYLFYALVLLGFTHLFFRMGIRSIFVHGILGIAIWYAFVRSGIHATLAGVALGLLTPAIPSIAREKINRYTAKAGALLAGENTLNEEKTREILRTLKKGSNESISMQERFVFNLHPWVNYLIMPLFALANAGVLIELGAFNQNAFAVSAGLILGKPIGIFLFCFIAVTLGISKLPQGVNYRILFGGGILAGIGFTMSLFISELAFDAGTLMLRSAKIGILLGSFVASILGISFIFIFTRKKKEVS
ncbi:MAG: Na+/H+ antiporter NhaA [Fibrobacter sp.]|jgi:NhaA family Na+:H+ antiporter|nr:Na+/H+ antiporter NhaA [Fibrobacter sp.]